MNPILSICIPTYNFGKFIGQTLDTILPQISTEVELIVFDGGSMDETFNEVASRKLGCKRLFYYRQEFRGGIDRDIEKVVSLARGKYCWLFSADDLMLNGAVAKILAAIRSNYDIYLCEHLLCTFEMHPIKSHPTFNNVKKPRLFKFSDAAQKSEYFRSARTSEAFFSFLSGPIFKKSTWDAAINLPESFRKSYWIVAGHLLSMIPRGITLYYLGEILIWKRGDNDSFVDEGMVNRYSIAINGFRKISDTIFGSESFEAFHIRRVICNDLTIRHILNLKLDCVERGLMAELDKLDDLVFIHYSDFGINSKINAFIYRRTPIAFYGFIKGIRRKIKNWNINESH